jgi:competence protein ComEA
MDKNKGALYLIAGAGAAVVLLASFIPKHAVSGATGVPASQSTVPPQLLSAAPAQGDQSLTAQPSPSHLVVYVCGKVRHPGVYTMPPGTRIGDGIQRAGGAMADADLEQLNLATPLADGMKVDVPPKGRHPAFDAAFSYSDAGAGNGPDAGAARRTRHHGGRSSHKLQPGQTLDVNTASAQELTELPGVGPSLAARIVEYRTENGPFQSVDDLQNVSGIGPSKFDKMLPYIRL